MSLATRCTSCGTVFRVVQDQLKVSEGWVRCGRCQEVFNAVEGLFDLDREAPPSWPQPEQPAGGMPMPQHPAAVTLPEQRAVDAALPRTADRSATGAADRTEPTGADDSAAGSAAGAAPIGPRPARTPPDDDDAEGADDFADARFPSELGRDADADADSESDALPSEAEDIAGAQAAALAPADERSPQFLRMAESRERWEQPRARASLGVAAVALVLLLGAQVAVQFRADVAARWPAARPMLETWCAVAGCSVDAPLNLQALAVDSSGLVKLESEGLYRLEVVLRNRAEHEVQAPALDVTLTDPAGRVVTRKVLRPGELGTPRRAITAGGELPLNALLSTGQARIAGYTVDLFYP